MLPDLTTDDYDALYAVLGEEMPRVTRSMFPEILAQLVDRGAIVITVTDEELLVRMPRAARQNAYRVERKRRLH